MHIEIRTSDSKWTAAHGKAGTDGRTVITVPDQAVKAVTFAGRDMLRFDLHAVAERIPADWPNPWAMVPATWAVTA